MKKPLSTRVFNILGGPGQVVGTAVASPLPIRPEVVPDPASADAEQLPSCGLSSQVSAAHGVVGSCCSAPGSLVARPNAQILDVEPAVGAVRVIKSLLRP